MLIRTGGLDDPAVQALLREHRAEMVAVTPPESVHALEPLGLAAPDITFWSVWEDDTLLGCGALRSLDATSGEIKSMRTSKNHRGRGVGRAVLEHIISEARSRGYTTLSLETGVMDVFTPARRLYERAGFEPCGPFAEYVLDPNTVFMRLDLHASPERPA